MKKNWILILKVLRRIYCHLTRSNVYSKPNCENDPEKAGEVIYNALISEKACMIARFGANELNCLVNFIGVKTQKNKIFDFTESVIG